jgi:hypothetical protein
MREGSSSEVKYKVQSGGRQINTNYDDLKANKTYYKRQTRNYNKQVNRSKGNAFLTIVFIVLMTVFAGEYASLQPTTPITNQVEAQEYIKSISFDVGNTAEGSISFLVNLIQPIAEATQTLAKSFTWLVTALYEIIGIFIPIDSIASECISYDDLTIPQKVNFQITWAGYRLANWEIQDLITQDFYLNIWAQNNAIDKEVCSS